VGQGGRIHPPKLGAKGRLQRAGRLPPVGGARAEVTVGLAGSSLGKKLLKTPARFVLIHASTDRPVAASAQSFCAATLAVIAARSRLDRILVQQKGTWLSGPALHFSGGSGQNGFGAGTLLPLRCFGVAGQRRRN